MRYLRVITEAAAVMLAFFAAGCVEQGPTEPTPPPPPPPLIGLYTLTVDASDVCRLPVSRFVWEVEATSSGSTTEGQTMLVRATLPAGDATLDLSLAANANSVAAGTLTARSASFGKDDLRVSLGGAVRATIAGGPVRGSVTDG